MFPLPTYSHSFQWSISIRFHGSKFSLLFFITAGILQRRGVGEEEGKEQMPNICARWPQTAITVILPLYYVVLERFLPFCSKAASSCRRVRVSRNLRARVLLTGTIALINKERNNHFLKGWEGKKEGRLQACEHFQM